MTDRRAEASRINVQKAQEARRAIPEGSDLSGLSAQEIMAVHGVSRATAYRYWSRARVETVSTLAPVDKLDLLSTSADPEALLQEVLGQQSPEDEQARELRFLLTRAEQFARSR